MNPDNITPPQPQSQLPAHHVSNSMKIVMLLLGLALIATLGYFTWFVGSEQEAVEEVAPSVKDKIEVVAEEAKAVDCGDKAYAFELTFDATIWKNYKVKETKPSEAVIYCYFEMPTDDSTWQAATSTNDAGYVSLFSVGVYTPAQWTLAQQEANKPAELGHNADYHWGWAPAQAYPDSLKAVSDDVKNVVATFKIGS